MNKLLLPSPLVELKGQLLEEKKINVFVKRDDLIHHIVSGNKWRKLKYNLEQADLQGKKQILTFGGAFSNHLIATATIGQLLGYKTIGVIRGEEPAELSDTLIDCKKMGMKLLFVSRNEYKNKDDPDFIDSLASDFGNYYLIPEGGSNDLGSFGCKDIVEEIEIEFDFICCAAGTGTTAAGVLNALTKENLLVVPALKGGDFLKEEVLAFENNKLKEDQLHFFSNYHFGGYAKVSQDLIDFSNTFYLNYQIKLDLVYTSKLFYGIFELISRDYFKKDSKIVLLHSGGLQGNRGIEKRGKFKLGYS